MFAFQMRIQTYLAFSFLLMHRNFSLSRAQCHYEKTLYSCSRQNLKEVPAAPSKFITELDISFNRLEVITNEDFITYGSLKSLIMSNNKIKSIQEQSFVPLTNLEKLDLSLNELDALSAGWFKNLSSLQYLNLLGNKYETLGPRNLFQPLKKLRALYLGGPHLQSLRKTDFLGLSGLEELVFDGKNLQDYAEGCFRETGPISRVTLGLNGVFESNQALVMAILSDVARPNTTLALTDTQFTTDVQMFLLKVALRGGSTRIIFKNVAMTSEACFALLLLLSYSNVSMLVLEDVQFIQLHSIKIFWYIPNMRHMEILVLKNIEVPQFYSFPALYFLQPLMKMLKSMSVINSMLFAIPCDSSTLLSKLEYLDISDNILSDIALSQMMCDGKGLLWNLQTFNISRNHLLSINSQLFTKLVNLKHIDMSGNAFRRMPETCHWPSSLRFLNLSSSHLTQVTHCLPESLDVLDLSNNDLTVFNIRLPLLKELYISGNKISSLLDGGLYPSLTSLSIQNNNVHSFSSNSLNKYNSLKSLKAASSTYVCSCDFVAFMTSDVRKNRVRIADELTLYICDSPYIMREKSAVDVRLSVFQCHTALAFSLLCSVILAVFALIAVLCHKLSVVWYMKMTWAWVRAKRKPKLVKAELAYDAFVSYSEMDSGWVEAHLVPELEQSEPPLRLCLHKRDFVPGGWILDNVMDAIEKSYKTLFIVSQHFVRSEWCKYELDYSHFRLFDQNDDTVVLILLEPIDKKTIPKRFCKLRRFMNSRTYLKWPDDDDEIPGFWDSLRAAINRPPTNNDFMNEFNADW